MVYVLSDDYYLYKGLSYVLNEFIHCSVVRVDKRRAIKLLESNSFTSRDIFIICCEDVFYDFEFLLSIDKSPLLMIAINNNKWNLDAMFDFVFLSKSFIFQDLIEVVFVKNKKQASACKVTLSCIERKVLGYLLKNIDRDIIGERLKLNSKAVSAYHRRALNKLGIRRPADITILPDRILEYV